MGRKDTGLSTNSPNEADISPNREIEQPRIGEDSDSELDEIDPWGGYMPLSQNPNDGEPLYALSHDSEDEEIDIQGSEEEHASESSHTRSFPTVKALVEDEQVWSKPAPKEVDIEMTDKKIDLVKQVMLNIQLPSDAFPAWAQNIPEDQWKDHLLKRLSKSDK